jgi:hypothetical protein
MTIHFLPPELDRYDAAVEDAIATCNGDIMGALKALLIVNEHLEAELAELQTAIATGGTVERREHQSLQQCIKVEPEHARKRAVEVTGEAAREDVEAGAG